MTASGPTTLPPVLTIPAHTKLNAASETQSAAAIKTRDESRALWEYLGGTGRLTSAGIQAACNTYKKVKLPSVGSIQMSTTVTVPVGTSIEGDGDAATIIDWVGAPGDPTDPMVTDGIMFKYAAGSFTPDQVTIKGAGFRTAVAGVTAIKSVNGGFSTFENLAFYGIARHFHIDGGFNAKVRSVYCTTYGSNLAGGSYFHALPHIDIDGFTSYTESGAEAVLTFSDIAAGSVGHINLYSPQTIGIIVEGDTQGVDFVNGVMTAVTDGVLIRQGGGAGAPQYNDFGFFNIDQPSVSGMRILQGGMTDLVKFNVTNSLKADGTPAGAGEGAAYGVVLGDSADVFNIGIFNSQFERLGPACIFAQAGAGNLRVSGCRMIRGTTTPAGDAAILISGGTSTDIQVSNTNMQNTTHSIVDQSSGARREYLDNICGEYPQITTPTGVTIRDKDSWTVDGVQIAGNNPILSGTLTANALAATTTVTAGGAVTVRSGSAVAWNNAGNTASGQIAAATSGELVVGGTTGNMTVNGALTVVGALAAASAAITNALGSATAAITAASAAVSGALGSATAVITAASAAISGTLTAGNSAHSFTTTDMTVTAPWTTFTPALAQGAAVAATVTYARHRVIGKTAHVEIKLVATAVGTIATIITITGIPAAIQPARVSTSSPLGEFLVYVTSTGWNCGIAFAPSSTTLAGIAHGQANFMGVLGPATALAVNDVVSFNGTYEIA